MSKFKTPLRYNLKKEFKFGSLIDLEKNYLVRSMKWALHDEAIKHEYVDLSASHERSPPR